MGGSGRYGKVDQNCFHEPASRDVMARSKLNDIQGLSSFRCDLIKFVVVRVPSLVGCQQISPVKPLGGKARIQISQVQLL